MERNCGMSESSVNIMDLPNEILEKIFKLAENDKNLLLTNRRFNSIIHLITEHNVSLCLNYYKFINPMLDLDVFLKSSSITLIIDQSFKKNVKNFEEKLEYFMKHFGDKIKTLNVECKLKNFATKFLPLLPNLKNLKVKQDETFDKDEIEDFSIKLERLEIYCDDSYDFDVFNIFNFDELCVRLSCSFAISKFSKLIQKHQNIKKLEIICNSYEYINFDSCLLKKLKLKSFEISNSVYNLDEFIKSQTELKNLRLGLVLKKNLEIICQNLTKLESFHFQFDEKKDLKNLLKLQNLKILTIINVFEEKEFVELTSLKFENLISLEISVKFSCSSHQIENFARNFANLKHLKFDFWSRTQSNVVSNIFEKFNNLETLKLKIESFVEFHENDIKFFFEQSHRNLNLKSLTFYASPFVKEENIGKLIEKFAIDFPNLERIDFYYYSPFINENFEFLLTKLPKLRTMEKLNLESEKEKNYFMTNGKNLECFKIDINLLNDPNEFLENFSIKFEDQKTTVMTRRGERNVELSMTNFNQWIKIRALLDSQKQIKNIKIIRKYKVPNYVLILKDLKEILENITNLTLQGSFCEENIEKIIKVIPNLKVLNFEEISFDEVESVTVMENENIEAINLFLDSRYTRLDEKFPSYIKFFEKMKFIKNSLKHLKFIVKYDEEEVDQESFSPFINFFNDPQKLIKIDFIFKQEKRKILRCGHGNRMNMW